MLFLSENYGYINETQLLERSGAQFDNIFKKVDIYNKNLRKGIITEGVHQNGNILFTIEERSAIADMLQMMQKNLLEGFARENNIDLNNINEGFGEIKDKLIGKMSGAWKDAMDFVNKVIKSGINTVKDFLKFFVQFFEKLGENANDCIRRSLIKLNVFGGDDDAEIEDTKVTTNESLTEAEQKIDITKEQLPNLNKVTIDFSDITKTQKEKTFLECVMEYVQNKVTGKQIEDLDESYMYDEDGMINEGKVSDWFQSKLANNKLYQTIVGSKAGMFIKKIGSIWGTFMIGTVGSTICYTVIPLFIDVLAHAFLPIAIPLEIIKWSVMLGYLGWQVYKIFKNRKKQIEGTDKKLISIGFCIQLFMTVGFFIMGQAGLMSKLAGHIEQSEIGTQVIKVVMWPLQKFFKYTGITSIKNTLTSVAGRLCNDMAIKFAENGVGGFANMTAETFTDTMSKLFAKYNLSWSDITSSNTGNLPTELPTQVLQKANNNEVIKGAQTVIQNNADEVPHNGGVSKKLADIKWEGTAEDGTQYQMMNAGKGDRVDAIVADVKSDYMKGAHIKIDANGNIIQTPPSSEEIQQAAKDIANANEVTKNGYQYSTLKPLTNDATLKVDGVNVNNRSAWHYILRHLNKDDWYTIIDEAKKQGIKVSMSWNSDLKTALIYPGDTPAGHVSTSFTDPNKIIVHNPFLEKDLTKFERLLHKFFSDGKLLQMIQDNPGYNAADMLKSTTRVVHSASQAAADVASSTSQVASDAASSASQVASDAASSASQAAADVAGKPIIITQDHQWVNSGNFFSRLKDLGLQMTMKGVEGLKLFTTISGEPISAEQMNGLNDLLKGQVSGGNIQTASKLLPMTLNKVIDIPAPNAIPVEPLINIPVMTFAERLNKHNAGNICLVLGTNTASWGQYTKEAMSFSKIEDKTMKAAITEISGDGKESIEGIGKYLQDLIHKVNNADNNVNEGIFDRFKKSKQDKQEKEHKLQDHACAILYVKNKDKKDVPAILFDYETMLAVDLIKQPGRKEIRKTPYYFAGLLGSIFMRPSYDMDQLNPERKPSFFDIIKPKHNYVNPDETRSAILKLLCAIIARGVKENYNLVGKNFVQYDKESKKYVKNPAVTTNDRIPQLGNCTIDQYLDVLNAKIGDKISKDNVKPLMAILSSNNKKEVKMFINGEIPAFDENGLSRKSQKDRNINKANEDYATKLYPQLNNRDGEFYKELTSKPYKQVAEWILDDDKNINMDILKSDDVIKYLDKTMETYELDTKRPWKEIVKSVFRKAKSDNEFVKNQNIQILIALIWKHYTEFKFNDEKINDKWGHKESEDAKSTENQEKAKETSEKPEDFDIPEEQPKDSEKSEEKPEEVKDTQKNKYDEWFDKVVTSRINKPSKTLYKELVDNETIKNYYQLSTSKANIYSITKDKALHYVLYNRFKTGKQPTEQYWAKKVPALIMKMQKAAKHKVDSERATKKAQVIREFYNIINKYARKNRDADTKKLWKKMKLEKLNLEGLLKRFNMI